MTDDVDMEMAECGWFLDCHNVSVAVVEHPICGDVEICQRHLDWLTEDMTDNMPNPTKMVPPMAAKHGAKMRAILQDLEDN